MQSVVNMNFCFFSPELAIKNVLVSKMNGTRLWFPFIALLVIQMKQKLQNGLDLVIYLLHLPGSVKQNVQVNLCQKNIQNNFCTQLVLPMFCKKRASYKDLPVSSILLVLHCFLDKSIIHLFFQKFCFWKSRLQTHTCVINKSCLPSCKSFCALNGHNSAANIRYYFSQLWPLEHRHMLLTH